MTFEPAAFSSGKEPEPLSELTEEEERWRTAVLMAIRPTTAVVGTLGLVFVVFMMESGGQRLLSAGASASLVLASLVPRIRIRVRVWLITLSFAMACILAIPVFGFAPSIFCGILLGLVVANVFLDRRQSIAICLVVAAALAGMGLAIALGMAEIGPLWGFLLDPRQPLNVLRVVILFCVAMIVLRVILGHFVRGVRVLLEEKVHALALLREETAVGERLRKEIAAREKGTRQARELEQLGRLAAFFCHDTKNSLQIILSTLPSLRDPLLRPAERAEALATLEEATRQIHTICAQSRVFGPVYGKEAHGNCAVSSVIPKTLRMLRSLLPDGILLTVGEVVPACVPMDEIALQRVLVNLALNARDAMGDHGTLKISFRLAPPETAPPLTAGVSYSVMEVKDSGPGIPEDMIDRIFEPFFTTKGEEGTGIGLTSVRQIVEACGGRITVASEIGKGATFSVMLPLAGAAVAMEHMPKGTQTQPVSEGSPDASLP